MPLPTASSGIIAEDAFFTLFRRVLTVFVDSIVVSGLALVYFYDYNVFGLLVNFFAIAVSVFGHITLYLGHWRLLLVSAVLFLGLVVLSFLSILQLGTDLFLCVHESLCPIAGLWGQALLSNMGISMLVLCYVLISAMICMPCFIGAYFLFMKVDPNGMRASTVMDGRPLTLD
jgi:hypothetical protein